MTRWTIALVTTLGVGVAAAGGYWLTTRNSATDPHALSSETGQASSNSPFGASSPGVSQLSIEAARAQRARQYQDVEDVAASQRLPSEFSRREALYVIAGRADLDRVRELIAEASGIANETERRATLEILLLRYAEIDPDAALRAALEMERKASIRLVGALARVAPQKSWEAVAALDDSPAQMEYRGAIIQAWAQQQPRQAFLSVAALTSQWQREQLLRLATTELAQRDPQLAIELVKAAPHADTNSLLLIVADEWSSRDPAAAARWVESFTDSTVNSRLAYQIVDAYVAQSPEEALAWALRISRSPGRNLWSHAVGQLAASNPEEAFRLAQAAENMMQRDQATSTVVRAIAARDPSLAMSYARKLATAEARANAIAEIAMQVASTNPAGALAWIEDNMDGQANRTATLRRLGRIMAQQDVEAAVRLMDRVPKEARASWINNIAGVYALQDVDKGIQWVGKHRDESNGLVARFARTVAQHNPETALDIVDRFADGKERDQVLTTLVAPLASQSPQIGARTVEKIRNKELQASATAEVAQIWAAHDPSAARKWVVGLDDGLARDRSIASMIGSISSFDDTLSLIGQIQTAEERMNAVSYKALVLSRTDQEAMRTLLRRYPLDPQRQRQLDEVINSADRSYAMYDPYGGGKFIYEEGD